jgi:hypothetical protein
MDSLDFESGYNRANLSTYKKWVGAQCWKEGNATEREFGKLLEGIYTDVKEATKEQQYKHIDWVCSAGTIDVKAMKRVSRHGKKSPDTIWIEFKNTLGNHGWVYGEQDFIAFEQADHYIMVRQKDLAELADRLCDKDSYVYTAREALYKVYNRKTNRDLISMIKTNDLLTLQHRKIQK